MARSRTKLRCIKYKKANWGGIAALQLVFTNGHQSPLFKLKWSCNLELQSIEIGQNQFIRHVHFRHYDENVVAVRLIDANGNFLDIGNYKDYSDYKTIKHTIPEDEEIVGLKCDRYLY